MGHHLNKQDEFKSDKYDWCPKGYFALSFKDPLARKAIRLYATLIDDDDEELAADLEVATARAEEREEENGA